jgi:glycosyltransferase involved in cell wall biosynthesis
VKIALVHNAYQQPGGEDAVFQQECKMLRDHGQQTVIYSRTNWETDAYRGIRRLELAKKTIWASDTRADFLRLLRQEKPDVVHVHNTFVMISPSIYSACREAQVPVVQTLHNYRLFCATGTFYRDGKICEDCMEKSLWRGVQHSCYHHSYSASAVVALMLAAHRLRDTGNEITSFVALSEFARSKFVEGGLPRAKIFVKPNFVSPDPGARTGIGDYALFAGRISPEKGVRTLVKAWKLLPFPVPLMVIGGGPEQAELEAWAAREGLTNIHFKGQLPREQTLAAINNARFMIIPSEWYETFCMAIAESFACSTPVICSRLGVMEELVSDGRTGLHFTHGNAEDLARKVDWAWTHPEEMSAMGKQARTEYESKYTAEKNYPQLMEIYEQAVALQKTSSL